MTRMVEPGDEVIGEVNASAESGGGLEIHLAGRRAFCLDDVVGMSVRLLVVAER